MLSLAEFLPDRAAEEAVIRALDEVRRVYTMQGRLDQLRGPVAELVATPDPRGVYEHRDAVCGEHAVMLFAAETDCVPLFRLRVEGMGDRGNLEFFLLVAGRLGASEVIRYLGAQGVDVNAAEADGLHHHTALHWAVYQTHPAAVAALIAQPGIDLDRTDGHGTTALDLALGRPHRMECARLLTEAGATVRPDTVVDVVRRGDLAALELTLHHGADVNALGPKTGIGPLHAAAMQLDERMIKRLLTAGADPGLTTRRQFKAAGVTYPRGMKALDYVDLSYPRRKSRAGSPDAELAVDAKAVTVRNLLLEAAAEGH